jgi:hypothetical protein
MDRELLEPMDRELFEPMNRELLEPMDRELLEQMDRELLKMMDREQREQMDREALEAMDRQLSEAMEENALQERAQASYDMVVLVLAQPEEKKKNKKDGKRKVDTDNISLLGLPGVRWWTQRVTLGARERFDFETINLNLYEQFVLGSLCIEFELV